ncbi:hypothetical protein CH63R_07481 [Colletotrichum higginsianum IMI 349063]|uniref:Uncharacterized protein n=2 Tax=Colletotrichum higginsianum TaxID=80884 RepID=A0A1B7Y9I1_COLHI|nr:hypothetical protein CH63R_07481 [Colletotrichum higginsianum IMI 349063]OBR08716.1 hypothetical protein CH63R_07481 [Colletotrichum higginsianum IMI 349063]GJC97222.1 hypothetical protein ColKHC_06048 [Colletotrichum higginsianum]
MAKMSRSKQGALQTKRRKQRGEAESVEKLKTKCAQEHGKAHVAHCKECYGEVVETMRSRYIDSKDEWFSDDKAFLSDLDGLFAKVKNFSEDLKAIETRIDKEKQKHYRESLPKSAAGRVAEASIGKAEFQAALADEEKPTTALIEDVRRALYKGVDDAPGLEELASKFDDVVFEKEAGVVVDVFFRDPRTGEIPASCKKYVEKLRSGVPIEDVMLAMAADRPARSQALANMDKHRRTLNELKRAQAAHEQDKLLKAQKRQQPPPQAPQVNKELYDLPPCLACSGKVSPDEVIACPLCLIFAELSLTKRTVFDSEKCYDEAYDEHVQTAHSCAAGEGCVQLKDEDEEMGGNGEGPVICEECAEQLGQSIVYCSSRCASADFQEHREGVHIPNWQGLGIDLGTQGEHLVYDNDEKTKYHVNDISKFVWRLSDAFERVFKGNNPDIKDVQH